MRLSIASAVGQGMLLLGTILAARHVAPADFGVLGVFATCAVIFGMLASGRLEAAIPLPTRDSRAMSIVVLACLLIPLVAAGSWIFMTTIGHGILMWADAGRLTTWSWSVPTATAIIGCRAVALGWATRRGFITIMAAGRIANGVILGSMFAIAASQTDRLRWLIIAWITGQAAEFLVIGIGVLRDSAFRAPPRRPVRLRRVAQRYRRFPAVLLWSHLMEQVSLHLPTALVSAGFGSDVAGRFNLVQRIVARPLAIIGTSVSVVLISDAGRRIRARLDLRPVLRSAIRRLASLAAVLFLPMSVIGPQLLPWLLGSEWTDAGRYLVALIPGVAADFIATPVFPILGLVERPWTQVFGSVLRLAAIAIAILGSAAAGLAPVVMLWLFSSAMVLVGVITIWWCRVGIETSGHRSSRRGNMAT